MPKKYTPEFRDRAVHLVYDRQALEGAPFRVDPRRGTPARRRNRDTSDLMQPARCRRANLVAFPCQTLHSGLN